MNRRNFLKSAGIASASIPSSMLGVGVENPKYITTIDLTEIDDDASIYILKENETEPEFIGLVKDYKEQKVQGYDCPILIRIRKVGYKPYEYQGERIIRPILLRDYFYENSLI